ncbi:putative F-box protein At1g49610 [Fagus crenata]
MDHNELYTAVDRISELPDHLLQEILCFLPTKQVVQSTILSKRWQHMCNSIPVLKLNTSSFGSTSWRDLVGKKKRNIPKQKRRDIQRKNANFYNFVNKTLRSLSVKKFTLTDCLDKQQSVSRVDHWIGFVVKSNVEELDLFYLQGQCRRRYHLPKSVFLAKSLTVLSLDWYDQTIHKLVAGSPVIQDMEFTGCHGLKSIKFESLTKAMSIKMEDCHMLERLKISSHSLKTLYLTHRLNRDWGNKLVEVDIDTPNLCKLAYCSFAFIPFSLNALALSEATYHELDPIAPWNFEKIKCFAKLNNSKLLTLESHFAKDMVIPKKLRETLPSSSYNVKQLQLKTANLFTGLEIAELIDSLLWISPLPEIILVVVLWKASISFKFSYEKPILKGEKPSCCKFLPVPCWRHCLRSVMIENFRVSTNEETLKAVEASLEKYFHENTEILETFQFIPGDIALDIVKMEP